MIRSDFNFAEFDDDFYLITNYAGRYSFLSNSEFGEFCNGIIPVSKKEELERNYFVSKGDSENFIRHYSHAIREYRNYLFSGTGLHIFVLTNQCNLNCVYSQASTQKSSPQKTDTVSMPRGAPSSTTAGKTRMTRTEKKVRVCRRFRREIR